MIEHLSENSFGSLLPNLAYRKVKRLIDIGVSAAALAVLAVPLLVVALAVRCNSPGPGLFRQDRMGYRGHCFQVMKFRTMYHARQSAPDPLRAAITVENDSRITGFGRFLRRSRIDELPQLVNVLKGEMSLIGPRPEAIPLARWYEEELPFYAYRHIVRPGITGWAQVEQGHVAELEDAHLKLHYDFYYIKNFSAWLDALIAMRTIVIMFSGFGSK
jgi:lipopolysaccharide/colanic/teichoic acid biosynthesis glycosyltransferase